MNIKSSLGLAVVLIVIAGGVYYFAKMNPQVAPVVSDTSATYTWQTTVLGEHASAPGVPRTGVVLNVDGKAYPIGEYDGSCMVIENSSWSLVEGEKSGVICWWAGGGSEVGVFEEGGSIVVKEGQLDEGTAETEGFRGGFKTILEI